MREYKFFTTWRINAPIERVWDAIYQSSEWPEWWSAVKEAKVIENSKNSNGVGTKLSYKWQGILPYSLHFLVEITEIRMHELIIGKTSGELEGTGTWRFYQERETTKVTYEWNVTLKKPTLSFLAPIAGPFFVSNHNYVMREGEKGLRRRLNLNFSD